MLKDEDIRKALILKNKNFFERGIFLNEFSIAQKNIVDLACFSEEGFFGFEIKSEADNLKRLTNQLRTYVNFFDFLYVVCHKKHTPEVVGLLNKYKLSQVGVIEVDLKKEEILFSTLKKASQLHKPTVLNKMLKTVKKDSLLELCQNLQIPLKSKKKDAIVQALIGKVKPEAITSLFKRGLEENYVKVCPKCKSKLVRNRRGLSECFMCNNSFKK